MSTFWDVTYQKEVCKELWYDLAHSFFLEEDTYQ